MRKPRVEALRKRLSGRVADHSRVISVFVKRFGVLYGGYTEHVRSSITKCTEES